MSTIAENLEAVRAVIAEAAGQSGRNAGDIELVAVSKTHPPEAIGEAMAAGQFNDGPVRSRVPDASMIYGKRRGERRLRR